MIDMLAADIFREIDCEYESHKLYMCLKSIEKMFGGPSRQEVLIQSHHHLANHHQQLLVADPLGKRTISVRVIVKYREDHLRCHHLAQYRMEVG
jgi:hypothetical protein